MCTTSTVVNPRGGWRNSLSCDLSINTGETGSSPHISQGPQLILAPTLWAEATSIVEHPWAVSSHHFVNIDSWKKRQMFPAATMPLRETDILPSFISSHKVELNLSPSSMGKTLYSKSVGFEKVIFVSPWGQWNTSQSNCCLNCLSYTDCVSVLYTSGSALCSEWFQWEHRFLLHFFS